LRRCASGWRPTASSPASVRPPARPAQHPLCCPRRLSLMWTMSWSADAGAHMSIFQDGVAPAFMLTHWARDRTRGPKMALKDVIRMQSRDAAHAVGASRPPPPGNQIIPPFWFALLMTAPVSAFPIRCSGKLPLWFPSFAGRDDDRVASGCACRPVRPRRDCCRQAR